MRKLTSTPRKTKAEEELKDKLPEMLSFWTSLPLEELAKLQGVEPAVDLDSMSALWPADDDPDELLSYILDERASRRGTAREILD